MKAYIVNPRKDKDDYWNGIGGAFKFTTKDGRTGYKVPSLNVVIMEPKGEDDLADAAGDTNPDIDVEEIETVEGEA